MPALLNAPNTFHNFNYIQFIFTINNSTICLLRLLQADSNVTHKGMHDLNNETSTGPRATNSRC